MVANQDRRLEVVVLAVRGLGDGRAAPVDGRRKVHLTLVHASDPEGGAFGAKVSPWTAAVGGAVRFGTAGLRCTFPMGAGAPALASDVRFLEGAQLRVRLLASKVPTGSALMGTAAKWMPSLTQEVTAELDEATSHPEAEAFIPLANILSGRGFAADRALGGWVPLERARRHAAAAADATGLEEPLSVWMQMYALPDHEAWLPDLQAQLQAQASGPSAAAEPRPHRPGAPCAPPEASAAPPCAAPAPARASPPPRWGPSPAQLAARAARDAPDLIDVTSAEGGPAAPAACALDLLGEAGAAGPAGRPPPAAGGLEALDLLGGAGAAGLVGRPPPAAGGLEALDLLGGAGAGGPELPAAAAPPAACGSSAFAFVDAAGAAAPAPAAFPFVHAAGQAPAPAAPPQPPAPAAGQLDLAALYRGAAAPPAGPGRPGQVSWAACDALASVAMGGDGGVGGRPRGPAAPEARADCGTLEGLESALVGGLTQSLRF